MYKNHQIYAMLSKAVCEDHLSDPDMVQVYDDYYSEMELALQCRRQNCAPDSLSLKPGSGATKGVLD